MLALEHSQFASLRPFFHPEIPAYPVGLHVLNTGYGRLLADRWPAPRAVLAESGGNFSLSGDPLVLSPAELRPLVRGFVSAPQAFAPLLGEAFPDLVVWERVVLVLDGAPRFTKPTAASVRRLEVSDGSRLAEVSAELAWVAKTWGGMAGLAASGRAWGAFTSAGRLASVACTFFQGDRYEDIGVATEPGFRRQGLSAACAAHLCQDILARGCRPSWNTSPDNIASLRLAEKLGFAWQRADRLCVIGVDLPGG